MFDPSHDEATQLPVDFVERMLPVIRSIARQLARRIPSHICVDDLIGAGLLGLVTAYSRFDPTRGEGFRVFQTYAERRIRGAMLDELRANDPLSRDQRIQMIRRATAIRVLSGRLGRAPEPDEVATELGITLEAYWTRIAAGSMGQKVSIDEGGDSSEDGLQLSQPEAETADDRVYWSEAKRALHMALASLPPRLLRLFELHYGQGLTLYEIGKELGVSESRVCQLESEAIRLLRASCREVDRERKSEAPRP